MEFRFYAINEEGAHAIAGPLLRRLLREGATGVGDVYRVELDDPSLSRTFSAADMTAFFHALDAGPAEAMALLSATQEAAPPPLSEPEPAVSEPAFGAAPSTAPTPPLDQGGQDHGRMMLISLAALLVLGAFLFWPRDGGDPSARAPESDGAVSSEETAEGAAPPPAPAVYEARFLVFDTTAHAAADGTSEAVASLSRGQRVQVLTAGGETPAPEGWALLEGGGFVTSESLRTSAPPTLTRRVDRDLTLPQATALYETPALSGSPRRTLAQGQRVRVVGYIDGVAELRIGMDLGYAAASSLEAAPPPPAAPSGPTAGGWPPPTIPAPGSGAGPPPAAAGALVLGAGDLMNRPSVETMARYYPRQAARDGVEAQVAVQCTVRRSGRIDACHVWRETRQGFGFGEATVRLVQDTFRAPRRTEDGRSTEGAQFRATITWTID